MPSDLAGRIEYSEKYGDDKFEYRHVILPKELAKNLPKNRLLGETEWRGIGVQQSRGWQHYAVHRPEPHILLFRRPLGTDPVSGKVDAELEREAKENYQQQVAVNQQPPPKAGGCCVVQARPTADKAEEQPGQAWRGRGPRLAGVCA